MPDVVYCVGTCIPPPDEHGPPKNTPKGEINEKLSDEELPTTVSLSLVCLGLKCRIVIYML